MDTLCKILNKTCERISKCIGDNFCRLNCKRMDNERRDVKRERAGSFKYLKFLNARYPTIFDHLKRKNCERILYLIISENYFLTACGSIRKISLIIHTGWKAA